MGVYEDISRSFVNNVWQFHTNRFNGFALQIFSDLKGGEG